MNNSRTNNSDAESLHKHLNDVVLPELKRKANAGKWNYIDGDNFTLYTFCDAPVISCKFISLSDLLPYNRALWPGNILFQRLLY